MTWEFTLIENFYEARETIIDEPIGWDALSMVLQRDADWHGINPLFSASNLQFGSIAYWILKDEYERSGIDGDIGIRMRWKCDDCRKWRLFFEGKIDFGRYEEHCEEDCFIIAGIEDNTPQTLLKNRQDIDVDLTSNIAYDGLTELTDYDGLNKEITIPSKALHLTAEAHLTNAEEDTGYSILVDADFDSFGSGIQHGVIVPKFDQIDSSELSTFSPAFQFDFVGGWTSGTLDDHLNVLDGIEIISVEPSTLGTSSNSYDVTFRVKGNIHLVYRSELPVPLPDGPGVSSLSISLSLKVGAKYGPSKTDAFVPVSLISYSDTSINQDLKDETLEYDYTGSFTVNLADNEKLWFYFLFDITGAKDAFSSLPPFVSVETLTIQGDPLSDFSATSNNITPASPCKTYMLHEAASRIVENITNDTLKFRSEYFGRTDSEPYAYDADGCGGLRALTNGLQLRQAVLTDGSAPKVFTNFKNLLNSLNALDLIGYGIEGINVRTEPVRYFYKDIVVFVADGVNSYTKKIKTDRIWNQFSFGFEKFETESTNGLDAIHTKRKYRIPLQNTDALLEKLCKYILDGYAEEVTRRKFGTTDDWRYDQDIFMLCLKRGETDVEVEQGNIDDADNMFDPPTVINYRLSPIRNALRWFKWLVQGIRQIDPDNTKLLFSSGEGNYVAEGKLQGSDCVLEANAIAEDAALFQNQFEDVDEATPFIVPEEVTFTFPLGLYEFLFLKDNVYGLVQYRRDTDDDWQFGWITKLEPRHEDGDAVFTLVTALNGTPVNELEFIITETGLVITNEEGPGWITENN